MVVLDRDKLNTLFEERGLSLEAATSDILFSTYLSDGRKVLLRYAVEEAFPYVMPEYTIEEPSAYLGLPHVGPKGKVCAFDKVTASPNPQEPEKLLVDVAARTIEILNEGILGENNEDYSDEFCAYWNLGADVCKLYSFVPIDQLGGNRLSFGVVQMRGERLAYILASSEAELDVLARKMAYPAESPVDAIPCQCIIFDSLPPCPFPENVREWNKLVEKRARDYKAYERFLRSRNAEKAVVVVSVVDDSSNIAFAVALPVPPYKRSGFRSGKVPLKVSMADAYGGTPITRLEYVDMMQQRLFSRGGVGLAKPSSRVAIVGCGSLGSWMAQGLSTYGVSAFDLIDTDFLSVENIARHLCGFSQINIPKANAVKEYLEQHNPNIECKAIVKDANVLLDCDSPLEGDDVVFITAADGPLEMHFIHKFLSGELGCTLVIMWVEPYALACHALVLKHPQDVIADCYDSDLSFKNRVVANADKLYSREAGCQSTYVQYSGLDIQEFVLEYLRWHHREEQDNPWNMHFCWIGALSKANEYGAEVSSLWAGSADYSIVVERID